MITFKINAEVMVFIPMNDEFHKSRNSDIKEQLLFEEELVGRIDSMRIKISANVGVYLMMCETHQTGAMSGSPPC